MSLDYSDVRVMRSLGLVAVAVLVLVVAACLLGDVQGQNEEGYILARKVAPSGGETHFHIEIGSYSYSNDYLLADGEETDPPTYPDDYLGEHYIEEDTSSVYFWSGSDWETLPNPGWVLQSISCEITSGSSTPSTYQVDLANSRVIIQYNDPNDIVECTFTNVRPIVGGVVVPANTFAVLAPWLAVIGLVVCVGTVVAVAKKRQSQV